MEMEQEISDIYSEAQSGITEKWEAYMKRGEIRLSKLREKAEAEIKSGSGESTAQKAYENAVRNYTLRNDNYKAMVDATTDRLAHTNEIALAYSNDQLPDIYVKNWAQVGEDLKSVNLSFTEDNGSTIKKLVNEDTVKRMIQTGDVTTPFMESPKYLNIPKDKRWNTKQINSSVLQGILQGESMQDIAKRIFPIVDRNASAAIRNARTLVTGAENAGRNDSYKRLEDEGVVMKKVWLATGDERTRAWHLDMDGQEVDPDESFTDGNGNKLKFPGDPSAAAETVYNCRCSMKTKIIGFRKADGSISYVDFEDNEESLHEKQIREEKERRAAKPSMSKSAETAVVSYKDKIAEIQARIKANGNNVTETDVYEAGKVLKDELNPVYEEKGKIFKEAEAEYNKNVRSIWELDADLWEAKIEKKPSEYIAELEKKINDLEEANKAARKKMDASRVTDKGSAELLKDKLSEVRPMGSSGMNIKAHLSNSRSVVRPHIEWAYDQYPTSWVQQSVDRGNLSVKKIGRGYYSSWKAEIAISGWNDASCRETSVHELGHRFEDSVKGLRNQEKIFYEKRTAGESLEWLGRGYSPSEKTRKDNFVHSYMGKDYGGHFYELVSMGFEYAYTNPLKLAEDPDMQEWILGLLAVMP